MLEFDGQSTLTGSVPIISSTSSIPPLNHHLPFFEAAHGCGCQISSTVRAERPCFGTLTRNEAPLTLPTGQWWHQRPAFFVVVVCFS